MAKIYLNESQLREMIKDIILEYNEQYNMLATQTPAPQATPTSTQQYGPLQNGPAYQNPTQTNNAVMELCQMGMYRTQWPNNARAAYALVNKFQNYPTKGAGWLRNIYALSNQYNSPVIKELADHCRQLINQNAKKQNSQRVTNYANQAKPKTFYR